MRMIKSLAVVVTVALAGAGAPGVAGADDPVFRAPSTYEVDDFPISVATGDLNNDGVADMVVPNQLDGRVSVFLGKGDGSFGPRSVEPVDSGPLNAVVADFNEDGKQDIATANYGGHSISILLGAGDGSFAAARDTDTRVGIWSLATGDFNEDGHLDLATANGTWGCCSVLLGAGDGTFSISIFELYPNDSGHEVAVSVADLDSDGHDDLVIGDIYHSHVNVAMGRGDGTFRALPHFRVLLGAMANIATADLNRDGHVDLAMGNAGNNAQDHSINLLFGNGDGTFQPPHVIRMRFKAIGVVVGDFNGDCSLDLAASGGSSGDGIIGGAVSVLLGDGSGVFAETERFQLIENSQVLTTGDFNADRADDLAIPINGGNRPHHVSVALASGRVGCGEPNGAAPTVSLTSPAKGATLRGTVEAGVSTHDDVATTKVQLVVDGRPVAESTDAPFTMTWDTTTVPDHAYTLTARAFDAAGNIGWSTPVRVTVDNIDTVSVGHASYKALQKTLTVRATSSHPTAALTVSVADTGEVIGQLNNDGAGKYTGEFTWPEDPKKITVSSDHGGSATRAVTAMFLCLPTGSTCL